MMVNGLVTLTQIGLLGLLGLLGLRMYALVRSEALSQAIAGSGDSGFVTENFMFKVNTHPRQAPRNGFYSSLDRTELRSQLHILMGLQERDCRVNGLLLSEAPEAVRAYATAWLYGAGCALSHKTARHSETIAGMVAGIASRKTGIRQSEAVQTIATLTSSNILLACYRAGLDGAEFWRTNHFVPTNSSLYEVVTNNAFI